MQENKPFIYIAQGDYLCAAILSGSGQIGLEEAIEKYQSKGNYTINFGPVKGYESRSNVFGTFDEPTPGCIFVAYNPSDYSYLLSGDSFGNDNIADIMKDCAQYMKLTITPTDVATLNEVFTAILEFDKLLWTSSDANRQNAYLDIREKIRSEDQ